MGRREEQHFRVVIEAKFVKNRLSKRITYIQEVNSNKDCLNISISARNQNVGFQLISLYVGYSLRAGTACAA
jgi:hypothetical protein